MPRVVTLILCVLSLGTSAFAEPFTTTGSVTFSWGEPPLPPMISLTGPLLETGVPLIDTQGVLFGFGWEPLLLCHPCDPGWILPIHGFSTTGSGTVSLEGHARQSVFYDANYEFFGDALIAPDIAPDTSTTITRLISGQLLLDGWTSEARTTKLFSTNLVLEGQATAAFARRGEQVYWNQLLYDFQNKPPIPEPASLLLVGSGLATLAAMRRRRGAGSR